MRFFIIRVNNKFYLIIMFYLKKKGDVYPALYGSFLFLTKSNILVFESAVLPYRDGSFKYRQTWSCQWYDNYR